MELQKNSKWIYMEKRRQNEGQDKKKRYDYRFSNSGSAVVQCLWERAYEKRYGSKKQGFIYSGKSGRTGRSAKYGGCCEYRTNLLYDHKARYL